MASLTVISSKNKNQVPEWALSTIKEVEELGFDWEFVSDYPVPTVKNVKRIQVRDEDRVGQAKEVNHFAEVLKRGGVGSVPPGVSSKDDYILDWNTRHRAALKLGWPTFPVVRILTAWDGAKQFDKDRFIVLGVGLNSGGPKGLTRAELSKRIKSLDQAQWDTDRVAERMNINRGTVTAIFAEHRCEKRAEFLGVPFPKDAATGEYNGSVTASTKAMLGQRSDKLADDPFREIVKITQEAGLTGEEASDLTKSVIAITTGDADRMALLTTEWTARKEQIEGFKASDKRKPPLTTDVRKRTKFFMDYLDKVVELVDTNPNTRVEYLQQAEKMQNLWTDLVEAQRAANEETVQV